MKFAHFADVHIGSWRDPKLAGVSTKAFLKAAGECIESAVDFILISGDFFNTSLPSVDDLRETVKKLKELKDRKIPVYLIEGSHDFSPTGKTMLDVLESAGLVLKVMKGEVVGNRLKLRFTVDAKTGAKITGIIGKKGMLERKYFENLVKENLESEDGFKIFMFHTAISEFKPEGLEKMDSTPLSDFPKGFDYYAGGHVHEPMEASMPDYGLVTYPGPLFPNNFRELEKLGRGGFYVVDCEGAPKAEFRPVKIHDVVSISADCSNRSPGEVEEIITSKTAGMELGNSIVTLRLFGTLSSGKPSEIDFKQVFDAIYGRGAHFVMKNTAALGSSEFEEVKIKTVPANEAEDEVLKEHISKVRVEGLSEDGEYALAKQLLASLNTEKKEGETAATFERRIREDAEKLLNVSP